MKTMKYVSGHHCAEFVFYSTVSVRREKGSNELWVFDTYILSWAPWSSLGYVCTRYSIKKR